MGDVSSAEDGPIIVPTLEAIARIPQTPYQLPDGYEWCQVDVTAPLQAQELHELLCEHYIEFNDTFRFRYSAQFLLWALCPPGYHRNLHLGVREASTNRLLAFIAGIPSKIRIRANVIKCAVINFLCIHKQLRSRRLTPIMIQEVSRVAVHLGIYYGVHTAIHHHHSPVSTVHYYHRILDVRKLVDVGFYHIGRGATLAREIRLHAVPDSHKTTGLREMKASDMDQVIRLYESHFRRFGIAPIWSKSDMQHILLGGLGSGDPVNGRRPGQVVWAYVSENQKTERITSFISFYSLPITVLKNESHHMIDAAYLFYYAVDVPTESVGDATFHKSQVHDVVHDAVIEASKLGFDVITVATWMENQIFLRDLKFERGSGHLHYFLHNWRTTPMGDIDGDGFSSEAEPSVDAGQQVGLILV